MRADPGPAAAAPPGSTAAAPRDLVVLDLPGAARFLTDSPSPRDLRSAATIAARLLGRAAADLRARPGADVITPVGDGLEALPDGVIALVPEGTGAQAARAASQAVASEWDQMLRASLGPAAESTGTAETPGFPQPSWVCVPPLAAGGHSAQWEQAVGAVNARRLIHAFPGFAVTGQDLCQLSPRWPAHPAPPLAATRSERTERLSAPNWVKRVLPRVEVDLAVDAFPSAASVASASYRRAVLERLAHPRVAALAAVLRDAAGAAMAPAEVPVPGLPSAAGEVASWFRSSAGPWVYPDQWRPGFLQAAAAAGRGTGRRQLARTAQDGQSAARELQAVMNSEFGVRRPSAYLALLLASWDWALPLQQAADGTRDPTAGAWHQVAADLLLRAVDAQRRVFEPGSGLLGALVHAGGRQACALAAASSALRAAATLREVVPGGPSAVAVLFFHHRDSLPDVLAGGQDLAAQAWALAHGGDVLAVGFWPQTGAPAWSALPWTRPFPGGAPPGNDDAAETLDAAGLFGVLTRSRERPLPAQLAADLERDGGALQMIAGYSRRLYEAEVARLVRQHGGDRADGRALALLGLAGQVGASTQPGRPVPPIAVAGRLAAFLSRECQ